MIVFKKWWGVLTIVLALGLGVGCDNDITPSDDDDDDDDITVYSYSYSVDEIAAGLFGYMSSTMTMNEWCLRVTGSQARTYDQLVQGGFILYKDKALKTPFTGSDILDENTIIYCESSLNGQDEKIGEITGTITLTDIPYPATTKVYMSSSSYSGYPSNWWSLNRKIDMSGVTDTTAQLNWSLPVYESLKPNSQATFELIVLPGDSLDTYTVSVPTRKTISDANADVGDLDTVSIRGVTLSGTITITYNGKPVPYVEIYARYPVQGNLNSTCLFSPGPDTPWSVTFGIDKNLNKGMEFQIFGYSGKNGTPPLIDAYVTDPPVYVVNNQSVSGIVLNVGDTGN